MESGLRTVAKFGQMAETCKTQNYKIDSQKV